MHPLEERYQLSAAELLDALERRFRARVALEGAVAEVHLGKRLQGLLDSGGITGLEEHDEDGYHDFTVTLHSGRVLAVECKNVRDSTEAFRSGGRVVAYKVETQKTRTSQGDPSSRFYDVGQFDIVAVCLGKKTGDWRQFMYIQTKDLKPHSRYPGKLAPMQRVPLPDSDRSGLGQWHRSLNNLLKAME